ncbi:lysylphosphatidylglycerol synthase domain-containing protein [Azospirillum aestuarii]|uniref:lysylphosphatidylglycerol synthase domain-containing protein n=1 Tax=Azospirillum aestuarii TaxID=2802052 RepID=UPI004054D807
MPAEAVTMPAGRPDGRLMLLAKLAVTLVVLGVLGAKADWPALLARVAGADPVWLAAGFTVKLFAVVCAGERWRDALRAAGERVSHGLAMRLMFTGRFCGQVLPGALGGDGGRGGLSDRGGAASTAGGRARVRERGRAAGGGGVRCLNPGGGEGRS